MDPLTDAEMDERVQSLSEATGATRAGCRAALQNADWDPGRAEKMMIDRPWMRTLSPDAQTPPPAVFATKADVGITDPDEAA